MKTFIIQEGFSDGVNIAIVNTDSHEPTATIMCDILNDYVGRSKDYNYGAVYSRKLSNGAVYDFYESGGADIRYTLRAINQELLNYTERTKSSEDEVTLEERCVSMAAGHHLSFSQHIDPQYLIEELDKFFEDGEHQDFLPSDIMRGVPLGDLHDLIYNLSDKLFDLVTDVLLEHGINQKEVG